MSTSTETSTAPYLSGGGGRYIEGELVGTPRVIYQISCDEPNGPGTPLP
jgi:hypothetical protein